MDILRLYLLFVAGIILSLLVPLAAKWLKEARKEDVRGVGNTLAKVWTLAKPYVKVAVGSAIVGMILVVIFLVSKGDAKAIAWHNAVIYGFGWDSLLQKLNA